MGHLKSRANSSKFCKGPIAWKLKIKNYFTYVQNVPENVGMLSDLQGRHDKSSFYKKNPEGPFTEAQASTEAP